MPALLLTIATVAVVFYVALGICILILYLRLLFVPDSPLTSVAGRLLIIAPHPADAVVMGAGQAMRTLEHGGEVRILLFAADGRDRSARAWGELGLEPERIVCPDHGRYKRLVEVAEIRAAEGWVRGEIERFRPDRVVAPLHEGGHGQHDAVNRIVEEALNRAGGRCPLFEGLLYNSHHSWSVTPRKLIALASKLLPFVRYQAPTEPVDTRPIYVQPMRPPEIETKRRMLKVVTGSSCKVETMLPGPWVPDRLQCHAGVSSTR